MIAAELFARARSILFLGAHCDDVEIGCGGTLLGLAASAPGARIHLRVLSSDDQREAESRRALQRLCSRATSIAFDRFQDGYFPWSGASVKQRIEAIRTEADPDVVVTHVRDDLHQDHRVVSELTLNTFRDHIILEYEIPKYDGGLGSPSAYVALTEADARCKIDTLMDCFVSQRSKRWFDRDTFAGLMRLRGLECNAPERFAEAFYIRKLRIS